jgi:hypothetical protein
MADPVMALEASDGRNGIGSAISRSRSDVGWVGRRPTIFRVLFYASISERRTLDVKRQKRNGFHRPGGRAGGIQRTPLHCDRAGRRQRACRRLPQDPPGRRRAELVLVRLGAARDQSQRMAHRSGNLSRHRHRRTRAQHSTTRRGPLRLRRRSPRLGARRTTAPGTHHRCGLPRAGGHGQLRRPDRGTLSQDRRPLGDLVSKVDAHGPDRQWTSQIAHAMLRCGQAQDATAGLTPDT